ncbi:hypothetical protein PAXRUDRAFT_825807 [Paxillus rubicundulus Ve08.2h10]|uniref:Uncharacterized protein n=1 Tax=Paxillus rubicundulus Ve08.2h10 TaxID=930991 RepID=A0A0D0E065_9AGAM|nr:hypothetical protein PAXRUDRAFT_825807 [Paxillus rubicundulus Ve08.2h10]
MILCQGVITLRVWYLFSRKPLIRTFAVFVYFCCTLATAVFAGIFFDAYQEQLTTSVQPKHSIFVAYIPSLAIHTVLFGLKVYRFATSPKNLHGEAFLRRFLHEGMVMYAFASGSLLFTIISLSLPANRISTVYLYTALQSGLPIGTTVVSVCHAMLSIRSLASTFHVDPEWLLNHAEMSRVHWQVGGNHTEIHVEVGERD